MEEKVRQRLSRYISYLLRHHPEKGGLQLDARGMVSLKCLLEAIHKKPGYDWVTIEDIRYVVKTCPKQRFLLDGDRICARYGHNVRLKPIDPGKPVEPPEVLYHGTTRRSVGSILKDGLKAAERQFVHLSTTPGMALEVGRRRDRKPPLLIVSARKAYKDGIPFYRATEGIYLAPYIPAKYIKVKDT